MSATLRRAVLEVRREPALERVRRLDDVVVDRDHRVLHLPRERFGEEQVFGLVMCSPPQTYCQRCSGSGPLVRSMHCTSNQIGNRYFT